MPATIQRNRMTGDIKKKKFINIMVMLKISTAEHVFQGLTSHHPHINCWICLHDAHVPAVAFMPMYLYLNEV